MARTKPSDTFAHRLSTLRVQAGFSVQQLAAAAGMTRQALHRLERGDRQPSWESVRRLTKALGVSLAMFD